MLEHIIAHSFQVQHVALYLADRLAEHRRVLNRDLIASAALLHDITKTRSFETGEDHAMTGAQMLCRLGYHAVGDIIGQHVRLRHFSAEQPISEAEIVNYADKRVLHDRVVPLERRMRYIMTHYVKAEAQMPALRRLWRIIEQIEDRIMARIPPEDRDLCCLNDRKAVPEDFLQFRKERD